MLKTQQLLQVKHYSKLFSNNLDEAKVAYRELAKQLHPDVNKEADANTAFAHVTHLYESAIADIGSGTYVIEGQIALHGIDGKVRTIRYIKHHLCEFGELFYGRSVITYIYRPEYKNLWERSIKNIQGKRFPSKKIEDDIGRYLPKIREHFVCQDGSAVLVLEKTEDVILLKDLPEVEAKNLDPRHVAWIISSLYNILCYLQWANLTHNALSTDNLWISPKFHAVCLYGGWHYVTPSNESLKFIPPRTFKYGARDVINSKTASNRMDLFLVKTLGRELLGDISGMSLATNAKLPKPLVSYLSNFFIDDDAVKAYKNWTDKVLKDSFGPRKFTELPLDLDTFYTA